MWCLPSVVNNKAVSVSLSQRGKKEPREELERKHNKVSGKDSQLKNQTEPVFSKTSVKLKTRHTACVKNGQHNVNIGV